MIVIMHIESLFYFIFLIPLLILFAEIFFQLLILRFLFSKHICLYFLSLWSEIPFQPRADHPLSFSKHCLISTVPWKVLEGFWTSGQRNHISFRFHNVIVLWPYSMSVIFNLPFSGLWIRNYQVWRIKQIWCFVRQKNQSFQNLKIFG